MEASLHETVIRLMSRWKADGELNIDRMRESLDRLVEDAVSEFQVDNVDCVTDEEEGETPE